MVVEGAQQNRDGRGGRGVGLRLTLAQLEGTEVVLCATARLAQELREAYDHLQQGRGRRRWPTLVTQTVVPWLDERLEEAALLGRLSAPLPWPLTALQEHFLWQQVIEAATESQGMAALFDPAGMAEVAAEAHALCVAWGVSQVVAGSEEERQFACWQQAFMERCDRNGWREAVRYLDVLLDRLAERAIDPARLPACVVFAGFDRYKPQEERLAGILAALGCQVREWAGDIAEAAEDGRTVRVQALVDRRAECRAAVAWVAQRLASQPQARLAIVVPELAELRARLADLLDDVLAPQTLHPAQAGRPRNYNFTLGTPLARQPLVATALRLLALWARPQQVSQEEWGGLLRDPYWSAWLEEADARGLLEARMRRSLPASLTLARLHSFLQYQHSAVPRLHRDFAAAWRLRQALDMNTRRPVADWSAAFATLLSALNWPGERSLSSEEYQARLAFDEALVQLAELDMLKVPFDMAAAVQHLTRICRERIFQPQTEGSPAVQIMGLLETCGTPLDGLWVMGMNDHLWPAAARPNPLLSAAAQRAACAPNASADLQAAFAATVHHRLQQGAREVVFSHALNEGDRHLRPSPLLSGVLEQDGMRTEGGAVDEATGLLERLSVRVREPGLPLLEWREDREGPPLVPDTLLPGGTALLKAQAICPAWAFYQYRLGARSLAVPVDGLDDAQRGTLLHKALQCFWQAQEGFGLGDLVAMSEAQCAAAIATAVESALVWLVEYRHAEMPPRYRALEQARLQTLLAEWLALERLREVPFTVLACEQETEVEIEGLRVRLVADRVDRLDREGAGAAGSAGRVILDYKTGSQISLRHWAGARLHEPQLPAYAVWGAQGDGVNEVDGVDGTGSLPVVAVAFARVRPAACGFVGIAAQPALLPEVAGMTEGRRRAFAALADWPALLAQWRHHLAALAREILRGEAGVCLANENDLRHCEVLPLLRLAERRQQQTQQTQRMEQKVQQCVGEDAL